MRTSLWMKVGVVSSALAIAACGSNSDRETTEQSTLPLTSATVGDIAVQITIQSDWNTGYCAGIQVKNNGAAPTTTWSTTIDLHDSKIGNLWSAQSTISGSQARLTPFAWNQAIPAHNQVDLGFCATKTGSNYKPSLIAINDQPVVELPDAALDADASDAPPVDAPETPDAGNDAETPDSPDVADTPDTPDVPDVPDVAVDTGDATPDVPDSSDAGSRRTTGTVGDITVRIATQSEWATGYCVDVFVSNAGTTATTTWSTVLDLQTSTVTNSWSALFSREGTRVTARPYDWNRSIAPGRTINFGFCASRTNPNILPSLVAIDGVELGADAGTDGGLDADASDAQPDTTVDATTDSELPDADAGDATLDTPADVPADADAAVDTAEDTAPDLGVPTVSASLKLTSDWVQGYCAEVTVANTGLVTVQHWTVQVELNQSATNNVWNAQHTLAGTKMTATPFAWNRTIAVGGHLTFGFCATASGANYKPSIISASTP